MQKYNANPLPGKQACELCNKTGEITIAKISQGKPPIDLGNASAPCPLCRGNGFLTIVKKENIK